MLHYVSLCFIMLISKHDIIVKQSKFAHESFSRLSKKIVVKVLTTLKFYNNFFFQNAAFSVFKNEVIICSMFSKLSIMIDIENFKIFWRKIEEILKFDTSAILNDMRYRIVIAMNSLKIFSNFVCWKKKSFCWKWFFKSLKKIIIFYKMNIINAFCIWFEM